MSAVDRERQLVEHRQGSCCGADEAVQHHPGESWMLRFDFALGSSASDAEVTGLKAEQRPAVEEQAAVHAPGLSFAVQNHARPVRPRAGSDTGNAVPNPAQQREGRCAAQPVPRQERDDPGIRRPDRRHELAHGAGRDPHHWLGRGHVQVPVQAQGRLEERQPHDGLQHDDQPTAGQGCGQPAAQLVHPDLLGRAPQREHRDDPVGRQHHRAALHPHRPVPEDVRRRESPNEPPGGTHVLPLDA
eukprot:560071-Rhodomonas_salina.1